MSGRRPIALATFTAALLATGGIASAQLDPSMMSGSARPDGSIPAGTVTVRVLRGHDFDHPVAGQDVALLVEGAAGGEGAIERRDATSEATSGRATFHDVPADPTVELRAVTLLDGRALFSRPFRAGAEAGTAILLVGPLPGESPSSAPTPPLPGMQLAPPELAAEELAVGEPGAAGVVVTSRTGPAAATAVQLFTLRPGGATLAGRVVSDAKGIAYFRGLVPGALYLAAASYAGSTFRSIPFTPGAHHALAVPLAVRALSHDPANVAVGVEISLGIGEDQLEVFEVLQLGNRGNETFEPAGAGLLLPLPAGFHSAQLDDSSRALADVVDGQGLRFKGRLEPLDKSGQNIVSVEVGFYLPYANAHHFEWRQDVPAGVAGLLGMVETRDQGILRLSAVALPGMPAPEVTSQPRHDGNGKELILGNLMAPPGGRLVFALDDLPTRDERPRNVAAAVAALVLLVGLGLAIGAPRKTDHEGHLRVERDRLLDELLGLEREGGSEAAMRARREPLEARLTLVLRALDGDALAEQSLGTIG